MKKTYIHPTMDIVTIQTVQMIAASDPVGATFGDGDNGTAGLNEGTASGDAFSRGSLWDDED